MGYLDLTSAKDKEGTLILLLFVYQKLHAGLNVRHHLGSDYKLAPINTGQYSTVLCKCSFIRLKLFTNPESVYFNMTNLHLEEMSGPSINFESSKGSLFRNSCIPFNFTSHRNSVE